MSEPNEDLLSINLNRLEEDTAGQPQRMFLYGKETAFARRRAKAAKNALKLCGAELSKEIRSCPSEFNVEKVTEGSVEAAMLAHPSYKRHQEELLEAEYELDVLEAFVEALRDRREQLSNEVRLHGQMYFSRPVAAEQTTPHERSATNQAMAQAVKDPPKRK